MNSQQQIQPRLLGAERYISPDFARQEWRSVFCRTWLVVGRADEIPEPGDYLLEEIGPESVIMVRQEDGTIKCFFNVCQHRGNQLVIAPSGFLNQFRCAYHGWVYALDGECRHAQDAEDFDRDPRASERLVEIRSAEFGGFVWINLDGQAAPLEDYLGPVAALWQTYPHGQYQRISGATMHLPCNWKAAMDNFHEAYHVAEAHPVGLDYMEEDYRTTCNEQYANGHALIVHQGSIRSRRLAAGAPMGFQVAEELKAWGLSPEDFAADPFATRSALQQAKRQRYRESGCHHYAAYTDAQLTDPHHITVFPNLAVTFNPDGMLFLRATPHATDPERCVLDTWFYSVGKDSFWAKMLTSGAPAAAAESHAPRRFLRYGEDSLGPVLDDDAWMLVAQQKAFHSSGYRGAVLARQESRIAQYHGEIDRLMAEDGVEPSPAGHGGRP